MATWLTLKAACKFQSAFIVTLFLQTFFNPLAFRKAKIVHNFGLSECKRVKNQQPSILLTQASTGVNFKNMKINSSYQRNEIICNLPMKQTTKVLHLAMIEVRVAFSNSLDYTSISELKVAIMMLENGKLLKIQ